MHKIEPSVINKMLSSSQKLPIVPKVRRQVECTKADIFFLDEYLRLVTIFYFQLFCSDLFIFRY
jgi:hypothetical protein